MRLRVLQSVRGPSATTNPYVVQLVDALRVHADVEYFTWSRGLLGRYDVLHLHWPEVMVRREGRAARAAARGRFVLLMLRVTLLRTPVVRTVHNAAAHEAGDRVERLLLAWSERLTDHRILLTPGTPIGPGLPRTVIPHGDYTAWFAARARSEQQPGRLVHVGLLRPYKGVEQLLDAFAEVGDPRATLRIVGRPTTDALRAVVDAAVATDGRVGCRLEYVDDATLVAEVTAAQLVVLPYRAMLNSGALLLALSLGRPALVPATASTAELAAEVGEEWVIRYDGELTGPVLADAIASASKLQGLPDLARRAWPELAVAHLRVYRDVVGHRARPGPDRSSQG